MEYRYGRMEERLAKIEAMYRQPGSEGEKEAAAQALRRIKDRMGNIERYQKWEIKKYEFTVFKKV